MTNEDKDDGCRKYVDIKFTEERFGLIGVIRNITDEYAVAGYGLTVRQIYYQMVAADIIPNTAASYNKIQGAINDGRLAGLLPWEGIEDRGRSLMGLNHQTSPVGAIKRTRDNYRLDLWAAQDWRPEVWVEKQALEGVIGQICNRLRVNYYATKGYDSQSQSWRAGQRFANYVRKGQRPIVFHLGDHDPSGIDMTRDLQVRLEMFTGVPVIVQRLALNMNQVEQYNPPPNYAKVTDSRFTAYQEKYGDSSWELDALKPQVISDLIELNIKMIRDEQVWSASLNEEVEDIRQLDDTIETLGGTAYDN